LFTHYFNSHFFPQADEISYQLQYTDQEKLKGQNKAFKKSILHEKIEAGPHFMTTATTAR